MGDSRRRVGLLVALGLVSLSGTARPQSQQEKQRTNILDELGLKKKPPAPAPPPPELPPEAPAESSEKGTAASGKQKGGKTAAPAGPSFTRAVYPLFIATCKACHTAGGPAQATHLLFTGDPAADHRVVARFANVRDPEASQLLQKASGATIHGGQSPWPAGSPAYERVLAWIRAGARLDHVAPPVEVAQAPGETACAPGERHHEAAAAASPATAAVPPPAAVAPVAAAPAGAPAPAPASTPATPAPAAAPVAQPTGPSFATAVHPTLMSTCALCHRTGGPAGMTRFLLSGDAMKDEAVVRRISARSKSNVAGCCLTTRSSIASPGTRLRK